jgi:hypothetical protein
MTIRFLQTVASENPSFPFQAGQVINVPAPSGYLLSLCDGVRAEVVRTDDTERAVQAPAEQPEPRIVHRSRGRRARVH